MSTPSGREIRAPWDLRAHQLAAPPPAPQVSGASIFFVAAFCQPVKQEAMDLAFEFTARPVIISRFDFVKRPRHHLVNFKKYVVMCPRKVWIQRPRTPGLGMPPAPACRYVSHPSGLPRHCLGFVTHYAANFRGSRFITRSVMNLNKLWVLKIKLSKPTQCGG